MRADEWEAKYREAPEQVAAEPAAIVSELLPLMAKGNALDLACGAGRHALLLPQKGYAVTAVDASGAALNLLERRANEASIRVWREGSIAPPGRGPGPSLRLVQADLEKTELPKGCFDLIVCVNYLQRSLFPQIERALRPAGTVLFETYTEAQLEYVGGPRNAAFLLKHGELRDAFPALRSIFYRELHAGKGIATLLAQKPC